MRKNFQKFILLMAGVLAMSILIGYLVLAWTEPSQNPPQGNVPAPLNVGSIEQIKSGTIGASYFKVLGWDAVYGSVDTGGGVNRPFHLIGTYHGWDPYGVYIAGYNFYNNSAISQAKKVYVGGGGRERMTIDLNTGNVGIGTTAPGYKLDVSGDIRVSGNILVKDSSNNFDTLFSGGIIKEKFLPFCRQEITSDVYTNGQNQSTGCNFGGYTGYYDISNLVPENVKEGVRFGRGQVGTFKGEGLNLDECYVWHGKIVGQKYYATAHLVPQGRKIILGTFSRYYSDDCNWNTYWLRKISSPFWCGSTYTTPHLVCLNRLGASTLVGEEFRYSYLVCPDDTGYWKEPSQKRIYKIIGIHSTACCGCCGCCSVTCEQVCGVLPLYSKSSSGCQNTWQAGALGCSGNYSFYCGEDNYWYYRECSDKGGCDKYSGLCNNDKSNLPAKSEGWSCESIGMDSEGRDTRHNYGCYTHADERCGGNCQTRLGRTPLNPPCSGSGLPNWSRCRCVKQ